MQGQPGLTQLMAREAGFKFDPWCQEDGEPLDPADRVRLASIWLRGRILLDFGMVFGRFWDGFWDDFGRVFDDFWEEV